MGEKEFFRREKEYERQLRRLGVRLRKRDKESYGVFERK